MSAPVDYVLHLADNALVLGQRNAEWCGHGPVLEEDIAMANISLDLIGQARLLYQHAASQLQAAGDASATEDQLAYLRDAPEFRNWVIMELPHRTAYIASVAADRDYSVTIARNFLVSSLMLLAWEQLQGSSDAQLAGIAARSLKEVRYHVRHSTDWLIRLGDGTDESHRRMQAAMDHLMPYTQEFWTDSPMEQAASDSGTGVRMADLRKAWEQAVHTVLAEATLKLPSTDGYVTQGKNGLHTEHLSYLLGEMQSLARAHPGATW